MKIDFISNPPLKRVVLDLQFKKEIVLTVSDASIIFDNIKEIYPEEPNLFLLPPIVPGDKIEMPMGPLRYSDENNKRILEFSRSSLRFTFTEYNNWETLRDQLLSIILTIKSIIKKKVFSRIVLTYYNEFLLEVEDFVFEENFNINLSKPESWDLKFHDIFLGIVPYEEGNKKVVLRLRARGVKEDKYIYTLETSLINRNEEIMIERPLLTSFFNEIHDLVELYFIQLIKDTKIQKLIGMSIQE